MDWFRDSWELWRRKIDERIAPEGTLPANRIIYDNSSSGASSDTIQGAVDEVFSNIVGIEEALSGKANVSELSEVAFTGDYDDLSGTPNLADVATTGDYDDLSGRPSLATVATTGNYDDLNGKPNLATVATTGNYGDLNNTPAFGTAASKDSTTSISQNSQDLPVGGAIYTALSAKANTSDLATVATSGNYTDLNNTPTLGSVAAKDYTTTIVENGTDIPISGAVYTGLNAKANSADLASVATTGDYGDLNDKPTLGTAASKNSTNTITNGSTDLVESGTVYNAIHNTKTYTQFSLSSQSISAGSSVSCTVNGSGYSFIEVMYYGNGGLRMYSQIPYSGNRLIPVIHNDAVIGQIIFSPPSNGVITITNNSNGDVTIQRVNGIKYN